MAVARRTSRSAPSPSPTTPRPTAAGVIERLRRLGIARVVMLTGDNRVVAEALGRALGVDEVRGDLLPEEKHRAVADLVRREGRVAMVGDGVNDAPALATATVGVAMGAAGTDVALETADVVLMSDDLRGASYAIRLGRATVATVRANVAAAIAIKLVTVGFAIAGVATLWMAVLADVGGSLVVVANALRLLRTK